MPHTTSFARNQWYVAAYAHEVGRELLGRTVLGEPLVFYRTEDDGRPVVLHDRCVHRRYPLSESGLDGDRIVCGYHGFTYDTTGTCVYVPGQKRVPRTARVASYPVVEQDALIWVWIGDPALADPETIPRARHLDSPAGSPSAGWSRSAPTTASSSTTSSTCPTRRICTAATSAPPRSPRRRSPPRWTRARASSESAGMDDAECPPFYAKSTGIKGRITRWQDIEYHAPCLYLLHSRIAPVGVVPEADGSDPNGFHTEITYAITPSADGKVYDFWMVSRDWATDDAEVTEFLRGNNHTVVMQDVDALNLLQKTLGTERTGYQELSINIDTGGLAARRILARLVEEGAKPMEKVQ